MLSDIVKSVWTPKLVATYVQMGWVGWNASATTYTKKHDIYINEQRCGITYKPAILKSVKTESNIYSIISCIYKSLYALHPNGNQQTPSHHTSIGFLFATLKGDIAPRCPSTLLSFACRAPPPRAPQLLLSLRTWCWSLGSASYHGGGSRVEVGMTVAFRTGYL